MTNSGAMRGRGQRHRVQVRFTDGYVRLQPPRPAGAPHAGLHRDDHTMTMRPAWVLGWTAMMTVLLVAVVSVITLVSFLLPGPMGPAFLGFGAAGAVLYVDLWLRSASRFALVLAMAGVLSVSFFAPMFVLDEVLAAGGHVTVATVSKVYVATSPKGTKTYTAWLTDANGKPIARPLDNAGWRPVGDQFMVVFDPNGVAPTVTPSTVTRPWPLPATLVSAVAAVGGLALMARRREV